MNQQQKQLISNVTYAFDFAKVRTSQDYRTEPHYTAVVHIGGELQQKLTVLQEKYLGYDTSLQVVTPELLHVTLATSNIEDGYDVLHTETTRFLAKRPTVACAGLTAVDKSGSLGVIFWPEGTTFLDFRRSVAEAHGKSFVPEVRSHFGWSTLARFTKTPPKELIRYVQDNAFLELGKLTLDNATIYKPHRRDLKDSEIIARI